MANQYFTCVLDAWRDGKTLYGRMHYYRSGTYTYQDTSFPNPTMNLGGTTYTDTDFGNRVRSGINVGDVYSTTFSRTVAGTGDRTVIWSAGSGLRSDFAGSWSKTVNFPVEYTPPTGLSVSVSEVYTNGAKFNVSVSSYGNPSSASGRYIEAAILGSSTYGSPYRFEISQNNTSATITVTNSSRSGMTIWPNTEYHYGAYASNTQKQTSIVASGTLTTLAYPPTLSVGAIEENRVFINYSTTQDGGKWDKYIQYSLDGGSNWTTGATVSTGAASSGTFTISGLTDDTNYTLKCRIQTVSGYAYGDDITFRTLESHKLYGSVGGVTKKAKKLYGSVNGQSKEIKKLYASVNGQTKRVF